MPRSTQDPDQRFVNFVYGTLTLYGRLSQYRSTIDWRLLSVLQPQKRLPLPGLGSSAFAHHYSRNHQCFLFLRALRCFTSPRSPHHPIHSDDGNPASPGLGFPIRTPSDHSSADNSPRTIAASHVLHRLLVPRHPPCALHNLATQRKDARVHSPVLKQQPPRTHTTHSHTTHV